MTRDTSLRQRGGRRYSFAEHGNSEVGQRQGQYIIKNNLAEHWKPCYGDGVTVIRIFPQRNPDDPTGESWDPYRFSAEHNQFGDWMRRYPAVRNMGSPGVSFIMADPSDPIMENAQALPPWIIYNAIQQAVRNGQEQPGWARLLDGEAGRSAVIPKPSEIYLVQCAIMQNKMQVYNPIKGFGPEDRTIVMELSVSAGLALTEQLNLLDPASQAPDGDWENILSNGDPISLDTGRFITFYKLADGDPRQQQATATAAAGGWNQAANSQPGQTGRAAQAPIGFGCFLEPTFNGMPAALRPFEEAVAAKVKPWDDILSFPTVEEQAHLLASSLPPDVITYAFRDHPEWIPEAVQRAAVAATQVAQPQGGWQQAPAAAHGQPTAAIAPAPVPTTPPAGPALPQTPVPGAIAPGAPATFGVAMPAGPTGGPPPQISAGFAPAPVAAAPVAAAPVAAAPVAAAPVAAAPVAAAPVAAAPVAAAQQMAWGAQGNSVATSPAGFPVGAPPAVIASPPAVIASPPAVIASPPAAGVQAQAPAGFAAPPVQHVQPALAAPVAAAPVAAAPVAAAPVAAAPSRAQAALAAAQAAVQPAVPQQ